MNKRSASSSKMYIHRVVSRRLCSQIYPLFMLPFLISPVVFVLWAQTHADVSNVPMKVTREREACLLGSAILAAVGAGLFADIPAAVDAMVHVEGTVVSYPRQKIATDDGSTSPCAALLLL